MAISKLTSKYQATIPKDVRKILKIKAGDRVVFEILGDKRVVIRKLPSLDVEYLQALSPTLGEWNSEEDEEAFRDLQNV